MTTKLPRLAAYVLIATAVLAPAYPAAAQADSAALAELLLDPEERLRLGRMSPAQRVQFLGEFWSGNDPTPGTPENELLTIMRRRAERAERMFADEGGWQTDRGRVLVVLGLPLEVERRVRVAGEPPPEIVWTYDPGAEVEEVRFLESDGLYVLATETVLDVDTLITSAGPELEMLMASGIATVRGITAPGSRVAPARITQAADTSDDTDPSTTALETSGANVPDDAEATAPAVDAVTPEVRVWMEMVFGGVIREDFGLQASVNTFPAAQGTYVVLSFEIERAGLVYEPAETTDDEDEGDEDEGDEDEVAEGKADAVSAEAETEAAVDPVREAVEVATERLGAEGVDASGEEAELKGAEGRPAYGEEEEVDRAALVIFGAYLQGEPGSEDTVHAFIIPFSVPVTEGEDSEIPTPDTLLRSIAVTLTPGVYRLAWGVMDDRTGAAATRDDIIQIPDYATSGLTLTRPLVVRPPHDQVVQPLTTDEVVPGIRLGDTVFNGDLDYTFGRNEVVEVVVLVGGWQSDPAQPGKPLLEVGYRIVAQEPDGTRTAIARLPVQSLDFAVLGQQLPLGQVDRIEAGGSYQIEVRVTDLVSGDQRIAITPLRIRDEVAEAEGAEAEQR